MSYDEFIEYQKFSYRVISKPNQSFMEMLKNTKYLFTDFNQKSSYIRDIKYLIYENKIKIEDRLKLKRLYMLYKLSDFTIVLYGISSLYWHYKKQFFNSGSKFIEFYIIGKVFFNMILIGYSALFIFKYLTDPVVYGYFSQKEREWDTNIINKREENKAMQQRKQTFEKINKIKL
jgi:hypothetical protein